MPKITRHGGPSNAEAGQPPRPASAVEPPAVEPDDIPAEAPPQEQQNANAEEPRTVLELQAALRDFGQPVSGSKDELLERWRAAVAGG